MRSACAGWCCGRRARNVVCRRTLPRCRGSGWTLPTTGDSRPRATKWTLQRMLTAQGTTEHHTAGADCALGPCGCALELVACAPLVWRASWSCGATLRFRSRAMQPCKASAHC
jgi:hypothetical protein